MVKTKHADCVYVKAKPRILKNSVGSEGGACRERYVHIAAAHKNVKRRETRNNLGEFWRGRPRT